MNARVVRSVLRVIRAAVVVVGAACGTHAWAQAVDPCLAAGTPTNSVDMRVLIIAGDGTEVVLPAIKSVLNYVGVPYDVLLAKDQVLTADILCSAADGLGHARYQGVLLTTGNLGFMNTVTGNFESALAQEEWSLLWQYEAKYRVRQATFYTYPGGAPDTYGLTPPNAAVDTTGTPIKAMLTSSSPVGSGNPSGRQVFADLRATTPVVISNAYTYLATLAAGSSVTPLLVDGLGNVIASINNYPDGRKNLAVTTDGNPALLHTLSLGYGIVNWVTKGLYIGQRRVYLSPQPDDVMIADDIWDPATNSDTTLMTYRITASDYGKFITWQSNRNANNPGNVVMEIPFNAFGTSAAFPVEELKPVTRDDLTPAIKANSAPFNWMSHTYTHLNLDSPITYSQTLNELRQNNAAAVNTLKLANYKKDALITPDVSGLNNPDALRAMSDFGVRYVVSNTSLFCGNRNADPRPCPAPNRGIYNDLQPNILMVPRYPANLFYNVCTPEQWVSEYNNIYSSYWGVNLSYSQILDKESEIWLRYMLNFDVRPVMFHQSNMCAYNNGTRSLLGDLIDATIAKYSPIFTLPPQSRQLRQIGNLMADRLRIDAAFAPPSGAPLSAKIVLGATSSSIVLLNPTPNAVTVPITGVNWTGAATRESYGGQTTSKVVVNPSGGAVTIPGAPVW